MFTGQLIGYVGADARSNKSGKGFLFPCFIKSLKELETLKTRLFG